jgi:hypothetical protein
MHDAYGIHVQDVNAKIIDALAKYVFLVPSPSQVGEC